MAVSRIMIAEYEGSFEETEGGCFYHLDEVDATQAVVNAAWHEFDPNDEKTWPTGGERKKWWAVIESSFYPVIEVTFRKGKFIHTIGTQRGTRNNYYNEVCRYADQSELLYVGET